MGGTGSGYRSGRKAGKYYACIRSDRAFEDLFQKIRKNFSKPVTTLVTTITARHARGLVRRNCPALTIAGQKEAPTARGKCVSGQDSGYWGEPDSGYRSGRKAGKPVACKVQTARRAAEFLGSRSFFAGSREMALAHAANDPVSSQTPSSQARHKKKPRQRGGTLSG